MGCVELRRKAMNREQTKAMLPFLQAFAEGKDVQYQNFVGNWVTLASIGESEQPERYRIKPEPVVRYANIYPSMRDSGLHLTRELADNRACHSRIACIRIEFEEGQYDE
jgi:hypothetical protein